MNFAISYSVNTLALYELITICVIIKPIIIRNIVTLVNV